MESFDYFQTNAALYEVGMTATTVYITVVTAYMVCAYFAGSELKKSQLIIVSGLFIVFALIFALGSFRFYSDAVDLTISEGITATFIMVNAPRIIFFAQIAGIIAALKFMSDIRKNTKKQDIQHKGT